MSESAECVGSGRGAGGLRTWLRPAGRGGRCCRHPHANAINCFSSFLTQSLSNVR